MIDSRLNGGSQSKSLETVARQLANLPPVYDNVAVGLCLFDRDLRILGMNHHMAGLSERCPEEVIGRSLAEVGPSGLSQLESRLRLALEGKRIANLELSGGSAGMPGERRMFLVSLEPMADDDGGTGGVLCSALDITESRRAEAALRESEDHYRHTVELSPHIPWTASPDGMTVQASSKWKTLTGMANAGGAGWAETVHPEDLPVALGQWFRSLETGEPYDCDYRLRLADGQYRWVRSRAAPRRDVGGRILRWYGTVDDIHDQKMAAAALRESERRAREQAALIESVYIAAPVGLAFHDCSLRYLAINDRLAEINGIPASAMIGRTAAELFEPSLAEVVEARLSEVIRTGLPVEGAEIRASTPSTPGVERDFVANYHPVRGSGGSLLGVSVAVLEITERKRTEAALRESESRLARAIAAARMATWEWEIASDALYVSDGFDALFEQPPGSLRTLKTVLARVFAEDCGCVRSEMERALHDTSGTDWEVEFRVEAGKGAERWLRAQGRVERDCHGRPLRMIGVTHDVTEKRKAAQQIAYLAHHDSLTGLPNRRMFRQQLDAALASAGQAGLLALHCVDLDHFKVANDTLGHPAGDALLLQAADRLRNCLGEGEIAARLGGDEFAIIQTTLQGPDEAAALARRVITALDATCDLDGSQAMLGSSIGIALAPCGSTSSDELLKHADIALYRAKEEGRATFRFFEPAMDRAVRRKQDLMAGLRTALDRGELEVWFQPLVAIDTGKVTCFEALLRWSHPVHGAISPSEFIPVAEEAGLITRMGEWVLRTACREGVRWPDSVRVAVNLSPVQFRNPGLIQTVASALADSALPAGRLEVEITESVLLQDDKASLAILSRLRDRGVRIALDDFGTGFSSLAYLLRFPFNKIKIDRSFVAGLPRQRKSKAIVQAIVSMGRSLGISIAAEGVESAGQLGALRCLGCNEAQGYLFSRPVPAAEVAALLEQLHR